MPSFAENLTSPRAYVLEEDAYFPQTHHHPILFGNRFIAKIKHQHDPGAQVHLVIEILGTSVNMDSQTEEVTTKCQDMPLLEILDLTC